MSDVAGRYAVARRVPRATSRRRKAEEIGFLCQALGFHAGQTFSKVFLAPEVTADPREGMGDYGVFDGRPTGHHVPGREYPISLLLAYVKMMRGYA